MSNENERKWIVPDPPEVDPKDGDYIWQGHLVVTPDYDVRLRTRQRPGGETERTLTIKKGQGQNRIEVDTKVSTFQSTDLEEAVEGLIEKVRHEIEIGNHTAELDIYRGAFEGFAVVEVEDPDGFEPPEWFGKEVTEDERYKNKWIAANGLPTDS